MAAPKLGFGSMLLVIAIVLVVMPGRAAAFGAGNIPSIAQVEGHNWRHGDIEDMLKTIAFLHGKKWTTLLVQRTYFGQFSHAPNCFLFPAPKANAHRCVQGTGCETIPRPSM